MNLPLNIDFTDKVVVITGAGGVICSTFIYIRNFVLGCKRYCICFLIPCNLLVKSLRPRIGGLRSANVGEQELIPKEPLSVSLHSEHNLSRTIRSAASDKKLHIALVCIGICIAFNRNGIGSIRCIVIFRSRTLEI